MHSQYVFAAALALLGMAAASPLESRGTGETVSGKAAVHGVNNHAGAAAKDEYHFHKGDGSTGAGWPSKKHWASFDSLWKANTKAMKESCGNNGWGADDTESEINHIRSAIEDVAKASKVDNRFILATIMQESVGCVRVPVTDNGVRNPGLMQDHNGKGNCQGKNPCPKSEIHQMIVDGTRGTKSGSGLAALIDKAQKHLGDHDISRIFYSASRLYNSGSIDWKNLDNAEGATACYASDIANRLTGWVLAPSKCTA